MLHFNKKFIFGFTYKSFGQDVPYLFSLIHEYMLHT